MFLVGKGNCDGFVYAIADKLNTGNTYVYAVTWEEEINNQME